MNEQKKQQRLFYLKGLQGSGKSTWALGVLEKEPLAWVRVNKDDLRKMTLSGEWTQKKESMIVQLEHDIVTKALDDGKNVIVDNTGFSKRHLDFYANLCLGKGVEFTIKFFDLPLDECIARDLKRAQPVGKDVIMRMYNQYLRKRYVPALQFDDTLPKAICLDIDGTLSLGSSRGFFDWKRVGEDAVNPVIADVSVNYKKCGYTIIVMSGRDSCCRSETEEWLNRFNIPYDHLFMREEGNVEPDEVIKERLYNGNVLGKFSVHFVLDDRPKVCRKWRDLGLVVLQCGDPEFEF